MKWNLSSAHNLCSCLFWPQPPLPPSVNMDGPVWTLPHENLSGSTSHTDPTHPAPTDSSDGDPPMHFDVVTAVVYTVVFVVGLLGNTLAIYVVLYYVKIKTVTNMYILNLALADELYILGIPFLGTYSVLSYWPYWSFLCKVCLTADAISQFASTFCLMVMSIDRYLAVVHPVRSFKWRKLKVAKLFSAAVWVVSFLIVLPVAIYSGVTEDEDTCNMNWPEPQNTWSIAFILYTSILGFFGPLVVICLCYLLIVIRVNTSPAAWPTGLEVGSENLTGLCLSGEVGEHARGPDEAAQVRAEGHAHGGGHGVGVSRLLAALLRHQHGQPDSHHPHGRQNHLLHHRHPHLPQLLRQPVPLLLPLRKFQTELPEGPVRPQAAQRRAHRPEEGDTKYEEPDTGNPAPAGIQPESIQVSAVVFSCLISETGGERSRRTQHTATVKDSLESSSLVFRLSLIHNRTLFLYQMDASLWCWFSFCAVCLVPSNLFRWR